MNRIDAVMTELEALVLEERKAIVAFHAEEVAAFAERKEELVASITGATQLERDQCDRVRIERVANELRHNGMLLAHARDAVKGAIEVLSAKPGGRLSVSV